MRALTNYLENCKFKHIDDIHTAFELCENLEDVEAVIAEIPHKFGDFFVELLDEDGNAYDPRDLDEEDEELAAKMTGFRITNYYTAYDDAAEDIYDFEWAE